jgi:hypothetical protein
VALFTTALGPCACAGVRVRCRCSAACCCLLSAVGQCGCGVRSAGRGAWSLLVEREPAGAAGGGLQGLPLYMKCTSHAT